MNTWSSMTWKNEEEIANAGVPPRGDKVPPLEKDLNDDKSTANPPALNDENIRSALLQIAQSITTNAQGATTLA